MKEIWKDIEGYEGLYQVSNLGRVKSLERKIRKRNGYRTIKELIKKPTLGKNGYLKICLCKNCRVKFYSLHRIVAETFIPNPENKPQVDHINTNKTDNRVENLRWCTNKENDNNPLSRLHRSERQLGEKNCRWGMRGKKCIFSKPIIQLSLKGEYIRTWDCARDVYRELGICYRTISSVLKGRGHTAGGFKWKYA